MITHLSLFDFRNYSEKHLHFSEKNVVFFGGNGRGKTNILEALSILSVGKSWRETSPRDLIRHEGGEISEGAKIEMETEEKDLYQVILSQHSRGFFRNQKKVSLRQHFGRIPTLLFVPEQLTLFSGPKRERHRFFDRFLFQVFPNYRDFLRRFNRALKQKNALLKEACDISFIDLRSQLAPWNQVLSELIPEILVWRQEFLQELNPLLNEELQKIAQTKDPVAIDLCVSEDWQPTQQGVRDFFEKNEKREIKAQRCLIGPHRDDFCFQLREQSILSTASRGEERSVLLALLSAQKQLLYKKLQTAPILLLDDVFSELDQNRQDYLENLCNTSQIFFTTTHESHFENFSFPVQKIEI